MTFKVSDDVLDNGLVFISTFANQIHILPSDPTTYADVVANTLGNKTFAAGSAVGAPGANVPNGRKVSTTAFSDGDVTSNGTAARWAIVDSINSRLLANGGLAAPVVVNATDEFGLPSFSVRIPNQ